MPLAERRVLVTGGAGFVGSALVRRLAAAGRDVVVLDNLSTGRAENLGGLPEGRVRLVVGDVRDRDLMTSLTAGSSIVFHLAALGVRRSLHASLETHEVNATATVGLLEAARRAAVERFVYVSSSEVYGSLEVSPMSEEHSTHPTTPYGASKLAAEAYVRAAHASFALPVVIVRPFNAFGPRCHHERDSGEVIPKFMLRAIADRPLIVFGDGEQTRDFSYVEDIARGIELAGSVPGVVGETFNLGSGREIAIAALAATVSRLAGRHPAVLRHAAVRPGDLRRQCADASRARKVLGFAPRVGLEEGLLRLLDWYRGLGITAERLLEEDVVENWRLMEREK